MADIDFTDIECVCECCGTNVPIAYEQDLDFVWISTMAFVAIGVLGEGDADAGAIYCAACALRIIGPTWHALGKARAAEFKAWCQVDDMINRRAKREHRSLN